MTHEEKNARQREYNRKYRSSPKTRKTERHYRNSPEVRERHRLFMIRYRKEYKDKFRAYQRAWKKKNPAKVSRWGKIYHQKNKDRISVQHREAHLKRQYGMSISDYEVMYKSQNGLCGICGGVPLGKLHVDHDHKTSEVRGLLCSPCNKALGLFRDDPETMKRAISYLRVATARSDNKVVQLKCL